jgi:hypothetical protein
LQTVRFVEKQMVDGKETYVYDLRFDEELVDVETAVEQLFTDALEDRRSNVVFRCNLKDEAVTFKDRREEDTSIFWSSSAFCGCFEDAQFGQSAIAENVSGGV